LLSDGWHVSRKKQLKQKDLTFVLTAFLACFNQFDDRNWKH